MTQEQVNQLLQLQKLYESGVLSADVFAAAKAKVLNNECNNKPQGNTIKPLLDKVKNSKLRIPLLILCGMVVGFVCLFVIT